MMMIIIIIMSLDKSWTSSWRTAWKTLETAPVFERLGPFSFRSLGSLNGMDGVHGDESHSINTKSRAAHPGQRPSGGHWLRCLDIEA